MFRTIEDYLENPMGKGSTAIANKHIIKLDLDNRYKNLLGVHNEFEHYYYTDNDNYYFHIKFPSESKRKNSYDIVIEFIPDTEASRTDVTIKNYSIRVFSNCPSFTFTYAYVFNTRNLLIDFLKKKYDNIVLRDNPVIKNPGEIINFEKSIYFACKFLKSNSKYTDKKSIEAVAKPLNKVKLFKEVRSTANIEVEVLKENNRLKKEKEDLAKKLNDKIKDNLPDRKRNTEKKKDDHKILPRKKITGKPKIKSTFKK